MRQTLNSKRLYFILHKMDTVFVVADVLILMRVYIESISRMTYVGQSGVCQTQVRRHFREASSARIETFDNYLYEVNEGEIEQN